MSRCNGACDKGQQMKLYVCEAEEEMVTMTAVACDYESTMSLHCPDKKVISVEDAYYGRTSEHVCRTKHWSENWKSTDCRGEDCQPNVRAS